MFYWRIKVLILKKNVEGNKFFSFIYNSLNIFHVIPQSLRILSFTFTFKFTFTIVSVELYWNPCWMFIGASAGMSNYFGAKLDRIQRIFHLKNQNEIILNIQFLFNNLISLKLDQHTFFNLSMCFLFAIYLNISVHNCNYDEYATNASVIYYIHA